MKKFATCAVALATAALFCAPAQADITIGVSIPLTGPASGLGIPVKNEVALWPEKIGGHRRHVE